MKVILNRPVTKAFSRASYRGKAEGMSEKCLLHDCCIEKNIDIHKMEDEEFKKNIEELFQLFKKLVEKHPMEEIPGMSRFQY